jgi:hypothetical protein
MGIVADLLQFRGLSAVANEFRARRIRKASQLRNTNGTEAQWLPMRLMHSNDRSVAVSKL